MKRWSKCWRRVVNRVLAGVLGRTNWFAYVGEKEQDSEYRYLRFGRDDKPRSNTSLRRGAFGWMFFSPRNTFALEVNIRYDSEDTFTFHCSLPWLVGVFLTLDLGFLKSIEVHDELQYGFNIDRTGGRLGWHVSDDPQRTTFARHWRWEDLHGTLTVTHKAGTPMDVIYTQPGDRYHPGTTTHEMTLIPRTTRRSWTRFWKRDEVFSGYEVSLNKPPLIPVRGIARLASRTTDGIYGVFIEAASPGEAVVRYREMVLRERGLLSA